LVRSYSSSGKRRCGRRVISGISSRNTCISCCTRAGSAKSCDSATAAAISRYCTRYGIGSAGISEYFYPAAAAAGAATAFSAEISAVPVAVSSIAALSSVSSVGL